MEPLGIYLFETRPVLAHVGSVSHSELDQSHSRAGIDKHADYAAPLEENLEMEKTLGCHGVRLSSRVARIDEGPTQNDCKYQQLNSWCVEHVEVARRALTWRFKEQDMLELVLFILENVYQFVWSLLIFKVLYHVLLWHHKRLKVCAYAQLPEILYACQAGWFLEAACWTEELHMNMDVQKITVLTVHTIVLWCFRIVLTEFYSSLCIYIYIIIIYIYI